MRAIIKQSGIQTNEKVKIEKTNLEMSDLALKNMSRHQLKTSSMWPQIYRGCHSNALFLSLKNQVDRKNRSGSAIPNFFCRATYLLRNEYMKYHIFELRKKI